MKQEQKNPFDIHGKISISSYDKEDIGIQLDAFAERHGLANLRDRLRIGLNEVSLLAFEQTNILIKELVSTLASSPEDTQKIYKDLVSMCVEMQQHGPWTYTADLANPQLPEAKIWFMIAASETIGYERDKDLNDVEFIENTKRIESFLREAIQDPDAFLDRAKEHMLKKSEKSIRFDKKDTTKRVPIGEGFGSFLPMAIQGYDAGVVQDAEGWVFVGANDTIEDSLISSVGLRKEVGPDERNPERQVTFFVNDKGQKVIKKIHPGLLVVLSRSIALASSIVEALNNKKDIIEVAKDALGHKRVVQTTEANREMLGMTGDQMPKGFMRIPEVKSLTSDISSSTELSHPREDFYSHLHTIRAVYVYMDALKQLKKKKAERGEHVTEEDKDVLSKTTWNKMEQKVEELRHVNDLIRHTIDTLPEHIKKIVDMAGGAGDLGLAVATSALASGKKLREVEIVDPQEGVSEFMHTIIDHIPFRDELEKITKHNTGYLQDAKITPDSMVVAKHACGSLTDDIFAQWRESESPMLVAMTCCHGKAKNDPARYGFTQQEWKKLAEESDFTNTEIPDSPGKARDHAIATREKGNAAMKKLDMARVEYLRRHGFRATLSTTDKFPKGDVIIAFRLPKNFMSTLRILQDMEKNDPWKFEKCIRQCDILAAGGEVKKMDIDFGAGWTCEDYAELTRRFVSPVLEEFIPTHLEEEKKVDPHAGKENKEAKAKMKKVQSAVLKEYAGRIDMYINARVHSSGKKLEQGGMGKIVEVIKNIIMRNENEEPTRIREQVDAVMTELGY